MFQKVFGDAARLDPAMIAKAKAAKPGERVFVDTNGDGKNEECWFIDTNPRHTKACQPLLVRAIDEDGDMDAYKGPDLDSDLYVADCGADGIVDSITDYTDNDHDNDVDEMAFYFYMPHHPFFGDDVLRVWWGRDDGDDNLLWYDVNYNYDQAACQYRCHFSGDESFVAFGLRADSTEWLSAFENPFLFYDPDKDRCSEVALRIQGQGTDVRAIRYSFDADDDAYGDRTHDYDFSITAVTEQDKPVRLPESALLHTKLRGIPTQGWLDRDKAQAFVTDAAWAKELLAWDEMNANTDEDVARDPHERWEGVIAHGNDEFPQIGGPPCSALNKRYELADKPGVQPAIYYDPTDRKLHLRGASKGWLNVDYDLDGKIDATYKYADEDNDGLFDCRQIDIDGDGKVDLDWKMNPRRVQPIMIDWYRLQMFYKMTLPKILQDSQLFIDTARAVMPDEPADPVATFFSTKLADWMPTTHLGEYMRKSPAGARFYVDLVRDRAFAAAQKKFGTSPQWTQLETFYSQGEYAMAASMLAKLAPSPAKVVDLGAFGTFSKRIDLTLSHEGKQLRLDWPVAVRVSEIRKVASDFNPANCAVVAPQRRIDWREIPHQVDEIDASVGPELTFLADLPPSGAITYHVYYSPGGKTEETKAGKDARPPMQTSTAEDWVPPNIGWESGRCAYRAYWGQFDFFGKNCDQLIYPTITKGKSYHEETEWGIDALHVGTASGLGGLTLYKGDQAYLVQNPAGKGDVKFTKKQLVSGPVRAAVEISATNIVPGEPSLGVKMICIIYAGRQESEIRASVTGASGETMLAPGIVKLARESVFADEKAGTFGNWGWQMDVIGDIGMAVVTAPESVVKVIDLPEERRMQCRTDANGQLRYWILGDWRRGRQHPIAPTLDNWKTEVGSLAEMLNKDVAIKGSRE
jgi:hypothetical protein